MATTCRIHETAFRFWFHKKYQPLSPDAFNSRSNYDRLCKREFTNIRELVHSVLISFDE